MIVTNQLDDAIWYENKELMNIKRASTILEREWRSESQRQERLVEENAKPPRL